MACTVRRIVAAHELSCIQSASVRCDFNAAESHWTHISLYASPCMQAAWESDRIARLSALRSLHAASLALVGDGQKRAVEAELADRRAATASAAQWQARASDSLLRQRLATARASTSGRT